MIFGVIIGGAMKKYHDYLIEILKDPAQAAEYLNAALEQRDKDMFLVALRNVAEARGGMLQLSRKTKLNRANLYRMFSEKGNPEVATLTNILHAFGLRLAVSVESNSKLRHAA
jgi:probable addiction module antidote protein